MREVKVYIATSLDGYIAKNNNDVSWLEGDNSEVENYGTYEKFYNEIDTVILGNTTYKQIINELSKDKWPYENKKTYVITKEKKEDQKKIFFSSNLENTIKKLKNESGKDIWICGGASIINQLIKLDLIDEISITIVPTILGSGINLFSELNKEIKLKLISTTTYNGFVDLVYRKR